MGRLTRIVRLASGQGKQPRKHRPPGQSKILVIFQGFSELLGGVETCMHPVLGLAGYSPTATVPLNWAENPKDDGVPIRVTRSPCVLRLC